MSLRFFDRDTEKLLESVEIPEHREKELTVLMSWQEHDDAIYVYDLSADQLQCLGEWTGNTFDNPMYIFQLACLV